MGNGDTVTLRVSDITTDPSVQLKSRGIDEVAVQTYVEALSSGAEFPPVVVFCENGTHWLSHGFHRMAAYRFCGLAEVEAEVRPGTLQDAIIYAATANIKNGQFQTRAQRQEAGERLIQMTDWSDREIARQLAVTQPTVSAWRRNLSDKNLSDRSRQVTRGSATYTMDTANIGQRPKPDIVDMKPEDYGRFWDEQIAEKSPYADEGDPEWEEEYSESDGDEPKPEPAAQTGRMAVHFSSETPEHLTPPEIISAALECLGFIDLDPCSNSHEHPNVPARHHFTVEDDGLSQDWNGFVYMNPPYGREIGDWIDKLCREYKAGRVPEAIALVPARPDTQWWGKLRDYPVCFVEGRLTFIGNNDPAPFPSAIFYLGPGIDRFYYEFEHMGDIWQRIEPGMFGE